MTAGTVTVHLVFPARIPEDAAAACLTRDELTRAERFRFREDALHWMACRANLRIILGQVIQSPPTEVPLLLAKHGKPILAPPFDGIHFNLSHCPDLALVAVGIDGPVGIDLEKCDRASDLLECESTFCHPLEIGKLPFETCLKAKQLLRIWTAKEAVLKALGTGLSHPPECVRIIFGSPKSSAVSDQPLAGIEDQKLHELIFPELPDYRVFLSAPDSVGSIKTLCPI